jgi:catechol 2,3-dioxygenase
MNHNTWDLAHLAHVELLTPKLDESIRFFTDILGMYVTEVDNNSAYLRAYDDYEHHSLKLTAHKYTGMGHFAWRTRSEEALLARVKVIEATNLGIGWIDHECGYGKAYRFRYPDGHICEIYFDTHKYKAENEMVSALKNTHSRFPARGANVRRIDHLNLLAKDIKAFSQFQFSCLGGRETERIEFDEEPKGVWVSVNNKSYDLAITEDHSGMNGRLHHLTYAANSREEVLIAADIALENGIKIETGPHKHAVQQTFFLYMFEPGGNRIEVANATARLILDPDYETVIWNKEEREKGQAWGLKTVDSFHTRGNPMPEELL